MRVMSFKNFVERSGREVRKLLPEDLREFPIEMSVYRKTSGSYTGISLRRKGEISAAIVNLDLFYDMYRKGVPMKEVLRRMAEVLVMKAPELDYSWADDYARARELLVIRISRDEDKEELKRECPYRVKEDLLFTVHVRFELPGGKEYGAAIVNHQLLQEYGITEEQLFADAMENSMRILPPRLASVYHRKNYENVEEENLFTHPHPLEGEEQVADVINITNSWYHEGAPVLFYPGVMERIAECLKGSYIILLPTVNDGLAFSLALDPELLLKINEFIDISRTDTPRNEYLSDELYYYDAEQKQFTSLEKVVEKLKAMRMNA